MNKQLVLSNKLAETVKTFFPRGNPFDYQCIHRLYRRFIAVLSHFWQDVSWIISRTWPSRTSTSFL